MNFIMIGVLLREALDRILFFINFLLSLWNKLSWQCWW